MYFLNFYRAGKGIIKKLVHVNNRNVRLLSWDIEVDIILAKWPKLQNVKNHANRVCIKFVIALVNISN